MKTKGHITFIAGFLAGAVMFGGTAAFAAAGILASPTTSKILVNGQPVNVEACNINGRNYLQLRDTAAAVNFSVVWDGDGDRVLIDATRGYDPDEQYTPQAVQTPNPTPMPAPTQPPATISSRTAPSGVLDKDLAIWLDDNYQPYDNEVEVIKILNEERAKAGLEPLSLNLDLCRATRIKATEMVQLDYFSHTSPNYGSPKTMLRAFGLKPDWVAENASITGGDLPGGVSWNWMHSEGHKANILNARYKQAGIGVCPDGTGFARWSLILTE